MCLALTHFLVPGRDNFIGSYSQEERRDKDKLCQDPEINPGEADIVSLNVIESPWCLVGGGGGWSTDLLTFKSAGRELGQGGGRWGGMGGALLQAKPAPEYFFSPEDPTSLSVLFRTAATHPFLWMSLAPDAAKL